MVSSEANHKRLSLVWLRRDLRLYDHIAFAAALEKPGLIQPVFIFDTDILKDFPNKEDRRITFIAEALVNLHQALHQKGGNLIVLHGSAKKLIPELAKELKAEAVYASEDFESGARKRDETVAKDLNKGGCKFVLRCDHLIHHPENVLKKDGTPYLVFTPYSKAWRKKLAADSYQEKSVILNDRLAKNKIEAALDISKGAEYLVREIGYDYAHHDAWEADDGQKRLKNFLINHLKNYKQARDFPGDIKGTSRLSPYLRFGLVSIRECARLATEQLHHEAWLNELIWREFYAMVLYHFPETQHLEMQEKYRGLKWSNQADYWQAFIECRTGYPIIDAAMHELHATGWMHNRARMIVASFLTKDLGIDWRKGDAHFAQWLMDYDIASNVGGWQWAASTGTDAVPYFRIFNPVTQSKRFDPKGEYIKRWLPELKHLSTKDIHMPKPGSVPGYPAPIVDHNEAHQKTLRLYKSYQLKHKKSDH